MAPIELKFELKFSKVSNLGGVMMYRNSFNNSKMLCPALATLVMLLLQISMPVEAGLSCSKGGAVNVSEYLETPSSRVKGPFEDWVQSEVNTARALIETQIADFNPERAGNTLDELARTIGASRNRLARTQYPEEKARLFGVRRSRAIRTSFLGPEPYEGQHPSYAKVAYAKQSEVGESLKTLYETETLSEAQRTSYERLGVMRVVGEDEAALNTRVSAELLAENLSSDITWVNSSDGQEMTYYVYKKIADGDGLVLMVTGDALLESAARRVQIARIWKRIKLAWSEAIGASSSSVFYRKASDFAWLYAHHQPYGRGSSSILEVKLWALFASNGHEVELYDKHVDLHALSTMKQEDFNLAELLGL